MLFMWRRVIDVRFHLLLVNVTLVPHLKNMSIKKNLNCYSNTRVFVMDLNSLEPEGSGSSTEEYTTLCKRRNGYLTSGDAAPLGGPGDPAPLCRWKSCIWFVR